MVADTLHRDILRESELPPTRSSLDYHHALDLCAGLAYHAPQPVHILASSALLVREMMGRLADCETILIPAGNWQTDTADSRLLDELSGPIDTFIWIEPGQQDAERILRRIHGLLSPVGKLYIISSGWLSRFLPEWNRANTRPTPLGHQKTAKMLDQHRFRVETRYGFNTPYSILWGRVFLFMRRIGRDDLSDRAMYKMRSVYASTGWQAALAPVCVTIARLGSR